jgi:hypothetical protein
MYVVVSELNTRGRAFVRLWITPHPPAQPVDNPVDNFMRKERAVSPFGGSTYHHHMSNNKLFP